MWKQIVFYLIIGASTFIIVSTGETIEPDAACTDPSESTPLCPVNEVYSKCRKAQCRPLNCEDVGKPIACPMIKGCCRDGGCICKASYARNGDGICVPIKECPCNDDPNAESGCSNYCGNSCHDYNTTLPVACPAICRLNGCKCKPEFVYNKDMDRCVPPKDCACKIKNEEYFECVPTCPPEGCDTSNAMFKCAAFPKPGSPDCKPGCRCKLGTHFRNKAGECVPKEECEINKCTKKNEEYYTCPKDCEKDCESGCRCIKGYYTDQNGVCVPDDIKCPKNEFYTDCKIAQCRAHECSQLGKPIACADIVEPCNDEACVCNYGYARHDNGTCIPVEDCPSCNDDPNATSGCGHCGNTCDDYDKQVICKKICEINGCRCKPGFVYNKEIDRCVLPKDCPCKIENEEYFECVPTCPPEGCDTSDRVYKCAAPPKPGDPKCEPGCRCKLFSHFRNKAGKCVVKEECEINKKCPKNEKYVDCPKKCPGESCFVDIRLILCENDPNCEAAGCRCEPGFCRYKGKCTTKEILDSQCKPNETFAECPTYCGESCNVDPRVISCARPTPGSSWCNPDGCVCNPGYCRDDEGNCVVRKIKSLSQGDDLPEPEPAPATPTE